MYTVRAPNRTYNGCVGGVQFRNGIARTDRPAELAYFERAGYTVTQEASIVPRENVATVTVADIAPDALELLAMKRSELVRLATSLGIKRAFATKTPALIDAIRTIRQAG